MPRIEAKLRVFSFKTECSAQVEELKRTLTLIISAAKEVRGPCTDNLPGTLRFRLMHEFPSSNKSVVKSWQIARGLSNLWRLVHDRGSLSNFVVDVERMLHKVDITINLTHKFSICL